MQKSDDKFELFAAHHYGPAAFSALLFFVWMTIFLPGGKYILIFIFISKIICSVNYTKAGYPIET